MQAPTHLFDQTATPTSVAVTYDSGGSPIRTHSNGTAFACRVRNNSESNRREHGRLVSPHDFSLYAASGHGLIPGERVTVASKTLEVRQVINFDEQGIYDRIDCDEVTVE